MKIHSEDEEFNGNGIDLTPLIDMVFILLIFFIVTSSFVKESGMEVNRPSAKTAERQEKGNIIISVTKAGEIWIDRRKVDVNALRANVERLHAENPEGSVVIAADRDARTELLVQALDQSRLAGVSNVSIAAFSE
ncbi:ExbD/TolR family protein [Methylotuvimicrobium buryatense]|uniref:Biopolymer transporter ExbD n=1 Tax=Methylotuvimicrobium buryatense TaxID=95641 RepID=A0A4P9ULX4_METBY|nr:biopolymer transporter ExbD [Methylotuvimicrobium buryatense]QCW81151.1 biopolymer transporter ExbD [Methylotuvimicrobium buryatense]